MCRKLRKGKVRQYFPILEWSDDDVSEFIRERGIKCHPLYYDEQGVFHVERRLGCLGCPLTGKLRIEQFKAHPKLVKAYIRAGKKWLDSHKESKAYETFGDVYTWFAYELFYWRLSIDEFKEKTQSGLSPIGSFKEYLEEFFGIEFENKCND